MNPTFKKATPLLLIVVCALFLFIIRRCTESKKPVPQPTVKPGNKRQSSEKNNRDKGFDRRISYLAYSKHAKCRMECRSITEAEVMEIMKEGKVNYAKSDLQNARCPRYAVEGVTKDDQDVRIVFAQCNESTTVVTVIDLDIDWTCSCSGDDRKYEKRN